MIRVYCSEEMAAGAVSVPTIVPLRAPHVGQHKTAVDTRTKIELHSGNCHVNIARASLLEKNGDL